MIPLTQEALELIEANARYRAVREADYRCGTHYHLMPHPLDCPCRLSEGGCWICDQS